MCITEPIVRDFASKLGDMLEVKLGTKEGSPCKVGRARVALELTKSLVSRVMLQFEEEDY